MRSHRTKAQVADSRQFILETARRLYARRRVEDVSMDDIARAADYTRRTIYAYFKSADEIRLLIFTEDLGRRWKLQKQRIAGVETGLDKLVVWAEVLYEFSKGNPQATRLQAYWDYAGINRKRLSRGSFTAFKSVNDDLADGLRAIFDLGIRDQSLRPDLDIDMSISQFLYSLRSVIHRALSPAYSFATFDSDEYLKHFLALFARAIRNPKGHLI